MAASKTVGDALRANGVSRRGFMKFCAATASMMALPPTMVSAVAAAIEKARRPSVIWLPFQECTGCTESLTRSHAPTVEGLIFDAISLDYHHTLQAAAGQRAEDAMHQAMEENYGNYLLLVDGSVPTGDYEAYSCTNGHTHLSMLKDAAAGAAAIVSIGTCAAFGGIPRANPNPTQAVGVRDIIKDKAIINVSGCPPIPTVITGVLAHYLTFGTIPELDRHGRPLAFFGQNIHDRCYRRPFYERGQFAETFDDEGARKGYCLYKLGCKGPVTYNACATLRWNNGVSWPVQSGHGCLGCSEPDFWDKGSFYRPLSAAYWGDAKTIGVSAAAGAAAALAASALARGKQKKAQQEEQA